MAIPRILLAVPIVVAGMMLPAAGADLTKPPAGAVGMVHEDFSVETVTIHRGQRVVFQNDSRWVHILGAGRGGHIDENSTEPVTAFHLMQQNDVYTTGTWNTPGTYYMTCSVHPEMTTKIVVLP